MDKTEFLQKLKNALENDLDAREVQENLQYYEQYIADEVRKGVSEREVLNTLGDPWVIARNIIDAPGSGNASDWEERRDYGPSPSVYYEDTQEQDRVHVFRFDVWWKRALAVLTLVLVFVGIIAFISGVLHLLAPILVPLLIVMFLARLLGRRR
ncbi:MAG: DUF1700 domain-containing protein [Hespellia sp.]|nr:DUF1700 domain-containing protein [Hespellia sp.]